MIVNFRLKVGRDDEIICWINRLGEYDRSYHIREVLRGYIRGDSAETNPSHVTSSPSCVSVDEDSVNDIPQNININGDIEDLDTALNGWLESV